MNKQNLKYLIVPIVLLLAYFGYTSFFQNNSVDIALYKESYFNNCGNVSRSPNKNLIFNDAITKTKLERNNKNMTDYFERSSCVKLVGYQMNHYLKLSNYTINHVKGRNDTVYQISYEEILNEFKGIKNKNKLDEKIIASLEYYLNDESLRTLFPESSGGFQKYRPLVGPKASDPSGKYILFLNVEIAANNILDGKGNVKETNYVFDDISMEYVKVGE